MHTDYLCATHRVNGLKYSLASLQVVAGEDHTGAWYSILWGGATLGEKQQQQNPIDCLAGSICLLISQLTFIHENSPRGGWENRVKSTSANKAFSMGQADETVPCILDNKLYL